MKTSSSNKKVRELISMLNEGKLIPRPEFQRRLVWSREDKNFFLDSLLKGYPFPEIYLADGDVDLTTGQGSQLLVDGLQRVTTIAQYFAGDSQLQLTTVKPYKDLTADEKKAFLQYDVSVRDLGAIDKNQIIEVFRRINATKYSLTDIEINNAFYKGAFKQFCEGFVDREFFKTNGVFTSSDYKRMGDLRFGILVVGTLLAGYFNRDDEFEELLSRYNDDFPPRESISSRLDETVSFIEECGFDKKSRIWRKADLFSSIIEIDRVLHVDKAALYPSDAVERINNLYGQIEEGDLDQSKPAGIYYKAALQASNDRVNRIRRGIVLNGILRSKPETVILAELITAGLA